MTDLRDVLVKQRTGPAHDVLGTFVVQVSVRCFVCLNDCHGNASAIRNLIPVLPAPCPDLGCVGLARRGLLRATRTAWSRSSTWWRAPGKMPDA
ncbi:hypothetical protein NOCARDAX2BIS_220159 [Nocardioides sp. AX2bis]|nr:hypothetical protein NOCARDAX2BIS_220159 [Nocardioides sp. AX2bis]